MNRDSNSYTALYTAIMVIVVVIAPALTVVALRKSQQENERVGKMQQILRAVHLGPTKDQAIPIYTRVIRQELLVNDQGEVIAAFEDDQIAQSEAFQTNTANQFELRQQDHAPGLPVYVVEVDSQQLYIFPMDGVGLWGAIWGFLVVQTNSSTVHGTDFSHAGETPGLGAEIVMKHFSQEFVGKQLYCNEQSRSIAVIKHDHLFDDQDCVGGTSGGTLTSNDANNILEDSIKEYLPYIGWIRGAQAVAAE